MKVLLGIMVACVVVGAGYVGVNYYQQVQSASQVNATVEPPTASVEVTSTEPAVQKVDNPIDFKQLQAKARYRCIHFGARHQRKLSRAAIHH